MQAAPLLSLALGGLSAIGQFSAARGQDDAAQQQELAAQRQEQAAQEARALRERNAQLTEAEGRETARRTREAAEREQGLSRARAAASGTLTTGTPGLYLAEQERIEKESDTTTSLICPGTPPFSCCWDPVWKRSTAPLPCWK